MELKKLKIEKLDHFGRGLIHDDQGIIFVDKALEDDIVNIQITKEKKGVREAIVTQYLSRSKSYRPSNCPFSNVCGGCHLLNLNYQEQLKYKEQKVQELVHKMLREDVIVNNIESGPEFNYRNKLSLHVDNNKIGFYEDKSNKLVEISECQLACEEINCLLKRIKDYVSAQKCTVKDLMIRHTCRNESMISIYGSFDYEHFRHAFSDVKSIIINNQIITKDKYITDQLFNKQFVISSHSFFQVNRFMTEKLYQKVIDHVKMGKYHKCLDLYCGTGTIGLLLCDYVDQVIGIEVVKDAIMDANRNKQINDVQNINFLLGKTEDYLDEFTDIDLIIVDPPREGLDKKTKENLRRIKSQTIIYVSCDPVTLMRDLNELKDLYQIKEITPFDMFPNTYHVECVAVLNYCKPL